MGTSSSTLQNMEIARFMDNNEKFKAFVMESNTKKGIKIIDKSFLDDGDVFVKISFSSFNYKDGLAISGKTPILRKFPMIPGVDFCGKVINSSNKSFKKGDKVILNGWGVGENHTGGFSQFARVKSKWLIKLPKKISEKQSMIIGSAGYTAALCAILINENVKKKDGKILVTGASGGVGSIVINLLSNLGFQTVALSAKNKSYLLKLGAVEVIDRKDYKIAKKPLEKQKWAGCIDTVGGEILSSVISEIKYNGIIASTGLASSHLLHTTVYPFILRNITLAGVDCVYADKSKRIKAWNLLERKLDFSKLDFIKSEKNLSDLKTLSAKILQGKIKGRTLIKIGT